MHYFEHVVDYLKYFRVLFVGEPVVDDGGLLREFLNLVGEIAQNNALFTGKEDCRVPVTNMTEVSKATYKYVGSMLAMSLLYGGAALSFFASSTAQYIIRGGLDKMERSDAIFEVPESDICKKLQKVSIHVYMFSAGMIHSYSRQLKLHIIRITQSKFTTYCELVVLACLFLQQVCLHCY